MLLGAALVVSCALLLALGAHLTFYQDTWALLLERRGDSAADFLRPHNEHISVIPVAIEKLLVAAFGLTSAAPERIVLTAMLAATAVLVFVYVRRRIGAWPALFAAVSLLFLGPAWEVLLWPFEVSLTGSLLTGVAMLLMLERQDRRGDLAACVLLAVSVGFSSLGVAFIVGAAADILVRRCSGLWRAYVAAIPLALYVAWYAGYGHEATSSLSLHNVIHSPPFVIESVGAATVALLGLPTLIDGVPHRVVILLGVAVTAVLACALLYAQRRKPDALFSQLRQRGVSLDAWPALSSAAAFWLLAAFNRLPGREPNTSRYLHIGATFVILVAADLLAGARFRRQALVAGATILAVAVGLNLVTLVEGQEKLEEQALLTRSELGAIEIARRTVDPNFRLAPEIAGTPSLINVSAGPYLEEIDEYGSPAYTPAELARVPEPGPRQADVVLAAALPLTVRGGSPTERRYGGAAACVEVRQRELRLEPGTTKVEIPPGPPATLLLRRFADGEYPVRFDPLQGGSTTLLRIPRDYVQRPWRLRLRAGRSARVCSRRG